MRLRLYKLEELCEGDMVIPTTQDERPTMIDRQYGYIKGQLVEVTDDVSKWGTDATEELKYSGAA